ncbi:MAG: efflux transporter outer membrane subunit [Comamonas sp.]
MQKKTTLFSPSRPPRTWALPLALACAVMAAGCSHTSQFAGQSESVAVPEQWRSTAAQLQSSTPEDLSRWWQRFGDVQMSGLIEQALQANPSVQTAQASLRQARAQLNLSEANRLPSASASAGGNRSKREPSSAGNSFSAGIDASWEPDLWGMQANAVKAGEANVAAALATLEGAHVALAAEVAQNYIQLRSLQNRLRIAQDNLGIQRENQQITEWRVQAGLATSLDSEQARSSTAQTAAQIPSLQASLAQTGHALAILTGQVPAALESALREAKPLPVAPENLAMTLPADTLRQRPDVRVQEQKVIAAVANLSAQERANFPSLRLSGSLGLSAATFAALGTSGATLATSIAASLSQTLFDGGANSARVQERQAAVEIARINYRATVLTALQEVEDALVQLQGDKERVVQLQVAQEAASNAQLLANQRYSSGLVDFQTVLDTQRTLLSSQDSVATAQAAISTDYVRLYKALGGGWQPLAIDGQVLSPASTQP